MQATDEERAKREVGYRAVDTFVRPRTCIGLGTGSTARYAIERVGELVRRGLSVRAVATSLETERLCAEARIPLAALGDEPLDVAIDGADEVAADWSLIKGGGGALFREKAIALAAQRFVVIVTARKLVDRLGTVPLPVEVVPFSARYVERELGALGASVVQREHAGKPFATDNANVILDCAFGAIDEPAQLDAVIRGIHGVVCTGIFAGLTSTVLVAGADGGVRELARPALP